MTMQDSSEIGEDPSGEQNSSIIRSAEEDISLEDEEALQSKLQKLLLDEVQWPVSSSEDIDKHGDEWVVKLSPEGGDPANLQAMLWEKMGEEGKERIVSGVTESLSRLPKGRGGGLTRAEVREVTEGLFQVMHQRKKRQAKGKGKLGGEWKRLLPSSCS